MRFRAELSLLGLPVLMVVSSLAPQAHAEVDTLTTVFKTGEAGNGGAVTGPGIANGAQLMGYDFDPISNKLYIAGTASSGLIPPVGLYIVEDFELSTQKETVLAVDPAQYAYYLTGGTGTNFSGQPTQVGLVLNPVAVGTGPGAIGAYGTAVLLDHNIARTSSPTTLYNEVSKRAYQWNLRQATYGQIEAVTDVIETVSTASGYIAAAAQKQGFTMTQGEIDRSNRSISALKQGAFGHDGRSYYHAAGGTATAGGPVMPGLWRLDVVTNTPQQLITDGGAEKIASEVAVQQYAPGVDRIFFNASSGTGNLLTTTKGSSSGVTQGVNYVNYNSTTNELSAPGVLLPAATLKEFIRGEDGQDYAVNSIQIDDEGNYYIDVRGGSATDGGRRNLVLRLEAGTTDALSKVVTYNERKASFVDNTTTAGLTNIRTVTYAGAEGSFDVPQYTWGYSVNTGKSYVAGAFAFKPGDFNRDNIVDQDDIALFTAPGVLQPVKTTTTDTSRFKFDLNGDSDANTSSTAVATAIVDFHDVKALQKFVPFVNGDTNIDLLLDVADLNRIRDNYLSTASVWTQGDFNGDDAVNLLDLEIFPDSWLNVLHQPNFTLAAFDTLGYVGQFRADAEAAFGLAAVPEPTTVGVLGALAAFGLMGRRRHHA